MREYFARLPPYSRDLGSRLLTLVDRHYEYLPGLRPYRRARRIRQLYYGLPTEASPFDVTTVARMGSDGELTAINLNRLHHLGQRFLTMGVSEDFGWQPVTANADTKSQEEAILASSVLEHEKRASNLDAVRHAFNELSLLDGWSYFSVRWDPAAGPKYDVLDGRAVHEGRLKVRVHEWWRTVTDVNRYDANHDWVILTEYENRWDLAAKWASGSSPQQRALYEKIVSLPPENRFVLTWQEQARGRVWTPEDTTTCPVYTLFHRPTPAVPEGREVIFIGDGTILFDGPSVYGEQLPVYRVAANEMHGTPFGVSVLADVVSLQHVANAMLNIGITNNVNNGITNLAVRSGANLNLSHIGDGASIWEVDGKPGEDIMPLNLVQSSPETSNLAKFLLEEMTTQVGLNSVALGRQEHQMPASLAALLDQKAREFAGFFVRGDRLAVTNLGSAIIRCYRQFAKAPRVLEVIAGEGRRYMLPDFVGQKLGDISRVNVAVRSGMVSTPAGQMAFAEQLVGSGVLENPNPMPLRVLLGLYQRGSLDVALMGAETEDMLISRENDLISQGQNPLVRSLDNHLEHIKRHKDTIANPAVRMDERVSAALDMHVQAHIDMLRSLDPALLQMLGQPALPPVPGMAPPGGMPPPDGSGDGGGGVPPAAAAAAAGQMPPGDMPADSLSNMMAGAPPDMPGLPDPAQPPPGAPPPLA